MTNGSKYNYWTIKDTGERRGSKIYAYKCQSVWNGIPHEKTGVFRADKIEPLIFSTLAEYIGKLQEKDDVFIEIEKNHKKERLLKEKEIQKEKQEIEKITRNIEVMESNIPLAMTGEYPLSLNELVNLINKQKDVLAKQQILIKEKQNQLKNAKITYEDWDDLRKKIPTWQEVFLHADAHTKRVLVNRLIERIDITKEDVVVRFKINMEDFFVQSRINGDSGVPK